MRPILSNSHPLYTLFYLINCFQYGYGGPPSGGFGGGNRGRGNGGNFARGNGFRGGKRRGDSGPMGPNAKRGGRPM